MACAESIKQHYDQNLKAKEYIGFLDELYAEAPDKLRFYLTFIYDILKSGIFEGSKILEIGSGPTVHGIASASAFFSKIVMSDYVEDNCRELKLWLEGKSIIKQLLEVPSELEGYDNQKVLEDRIKKCVRQVVRCDVLSDDVFLEKLENDVAPPFDLIISTYCLEAAAVDYSSYLKIYKRINKLLRQGGGLIVVGAFRAREWKVLKNSYNYLEIEESNLKDALTETGFVLSDIKFQAGKYIEKVDLEYGQLFCVAAKKYAETTL